MIRRPNFAATLLAAALAFALPAAADSLPTSWDNLVKVDSKRFQGAYLLPGADFRQFNKIMLDPTEVAFKKNWQQDYNASASFDMRVTSEDVQNAIQRASTGFTDLLTKAYTAAGYQIVTTPGDDVLRVKTAVIDLTVTSPD